jgi:hypothetical protein
MTNESGFRAIIDQNDDPKIVPTDIEDHKVSNLIGGWKSTFYVIETAVVSRFQQSVPTIQTSLGSRMLCRESLELLSGNHSHSEVIPLGTFHPEDDQASITICSQNENNLTQSPLLVKPNQLLGYQKFNAGKDALSQTEKPVDMG